MEFNKEKEFEAIEEKLNEVRIACNRAQIPFVWVAAIKDDGVKTDYKVAVDENSTKDLDVTKYACHALVPGSMGIKLQDDKIKDIIKVLNGFKVVAKDTTISINADELSYQTLFPETGSIYKFDKSEGAYVMPTDGKGDAPKEIEYPNEDLAPFNLQAIGVLPRIDDDFK